MEVGAGSRVLPRSRGTYPVHRPAARILGADERLGAVGRDDVAGDEVDLAFEFGLAQALVQGTNLGSNYPLVELQNSIFSLYPDQQFASFLTNHDQNRVMSQVRGNVDAAKVAASLLFTLPGVPFIYYGEEIGMQGQKPDEHIRTPMQWNATPETAGFSTSEPWQPLSTGSEEGVNVADQTDDPDSLLSHYRSLIRLRAEHPALLGGDYVEITSDERKVFSFMRTSPDETLLVLINLNRNPVEEYTLSLASADLGEVTSAELIFGDGQPGAPVLNADGGFDAYTPLPSLPARSTTIIRLG